MPGPSMVICPEGIWTKVITSKISAIIHIKNTQPDSYIHTIRTTGDPAPTNEDDAIPIYGKSAKLATGDLVDVWLKAKGADGEVRIDDL